MLLYTNMASMASAVADREKGGLIFLLRFFEGLLASWVPVYRTVCVLRSSTLWLRTQREASVAIEL